ncbi:MAG TPA: CaiB/BaiF CoA-transferase family protein [Candidatus Elarobacter sp.]|jgi:alpha-methylacyl-CoA racemase
MKSGPLAGVRVIDLSRLVPGPYCSSLLADAGADVVAVRGGRGSAPIAQLARGKRFVTLDLREPRGRSALHRLVRDADVLIEGFRPGVAARLGAGYAELAALNPRLVYCSLTGYGQSGPRSGEAGHDINYLAVSGVLGALGPPDGDPIPPLNLLADYGAGGTAAAFAIAAALLERARTGRGRHLDVAMIDGCVSMMDSHRVAWGSALNPARGVGLLSGRAPAYRTYRCADGRYVAVGALERPSFEALWHGLGFADPVPDAHDPARWDATAQRLAAAFASAARDAWAERFAGAGACVTPVLAPDEAVNDVQVRARAASHGTGEPSRPDDEGADGEPHDDTEAVLRAAGADADEIAAALAARDALAGERAAWPPPRS